MNYVQLTLTAIFSIFLTSTVYSATYYVSKSGNDSNQGTFNAPWLTIQHGVNNMTYGDYLIVRPGTYKEGVWLGFNGVVDNPTDYIYIIGNGAVIMEGDNVEYSAFNTYHASWVHIENITVQNYTGHGINFDGKSNFNTYGTPLTNIRIKNVRGFDNGNSSWKYGIFVRNVNNFIIDGCSIIDSEWSNIVVEESTYGGILNCYVSHEGKQYYKDDADGIAIQNSQYIRVVNCIANYCHEDGIDIGGHSVGDIAHISVHNCIAMNTYSNGFAFSVTNDNSFDGYDVSFTKCLSFNHVESGLAAYQEPDDLRVAHCTFTKTDYGMHIRNENPQDIKMRNNVFVDNTYNFTHNNISSAAFSLSHTNWGANPPPVAYQGDFPQMLNPNFVNPSNNNYALASGSPCIDAAGDLTVTTNAGSGTTISVDYAKFFCDGFGVVPGDSINIDGHEALVVSIPNTTTIIIADPITWNNNAPVNFLFNGAAPDLGYKETAASIPNCSNIIIWAAGDTNQEEMELYIDGQSVISWSNIGGDFNNQVYQPYSYYHCGLISFECVTVKLVNGDVINGLDYNLAVDKISINGVVKETESPDVYGQGTFINGCVNGYNQTEKLYCGSGFFTYGTADSDQDGICNSADICPNFDDKLIGTSCDDNNPNTINDVYTTDCTCAGSCSFGQSCDDNDPCTVNDQIIDNACNCEGVFQSAGQGNTACDFVGFDIRVCLEGPYDIVSNTMRTVLWQSNLLPSAQPYAIPPWNYSGTEGQGWTKSDYPANTVDWVLVSFRTGITKNTEVRQTAALVLEDGALYFPEERVLDGTLGSAFYVVIQHRNHIGVLSPQAITTNNGNITIDFCTANSYAPSGFGQKELLPGLWVMYAGDGDQVNDIGFDINGQDYASWLQYNGQFNKYSPFDYDLNSDINAFDRILWSDNNGIYSSLEK